jgi:hypothetical protein
MGWDGMGSTHTYIYNQGAERGHTKRSAVTISPNNQFGQ